MFHPVSNRTELPEVNVEPLGDIMLDFLIERDNEEAFVDFKETMSIAKEAPFAKIAKDIFAFSNYGGGYILIGFKQKPKLKGKTEKVEEDRGKKRRKEHFCLSDCLAERAKYLRTAEIYRILLEKIKETRTIKIKGKNVDDLDLEKVQNLILQASHKGSRIGFKGFLKSLKKSRLDDSQR